MSNTSTPDDAAGIPDAGPTLARDDDSLNSVVVAYEGSADRQTLYPADATEIERLTHWLTADADAFRRLDEMR
ncbi:DUF7511 domain-containing protein [Haloplanus natans]|uniref:DUF7511 domain-containing protein n=1 Tax=Haloplanus natans TaxID=376171 RepID=UPI001B7FBBA0|nr:hypothetical protein [Haloplanus natans]